MKKSPLFYILVGVALYYVWVHYVAGKVGFDQAKAPHKGKARQQQTA